jgi:hypothetical protein
MFKGNKGVAMTWLYDEELRIQKECNLRQSIKDQVDLRVVFFTAVFFLILLVDYALAYEPQVVQCQKCDTLMIMFDPASLVPEAKEVPYAGWYCDNCGTFQCHGDRCVSCGCSRYKKKK